jgi:hypothetical protein
MRNHIRNIVSKMLTLLVATRKKNVRKNVHSFVMYCSELKFGCGLANFNLPFAWLLGSLRADDIEPAD